MNTTTGSVVSLDNKPIITIEDIPKCPEKIVTWEEGCDKFKILLTTNILIPSFDDKGNAQFETNCCNDWAMVIGTCTNKAKKIRATSSIFKLSDLDKEWQLRYEEVLTKLRKGIE